MAVPNQTPDRGRLWGLLAVVALSTPMAMAVETGMRRLMMPPGFDLVRAWLSPTLTPWAWATVPATLAATGLGWWLQRVLVRRELRTPRPGMSEAQARSKAEFEALMLASSAPQVPAVAATMLYMMGAPLLPVVVSMAIAMLGVLSLGLFIGSRGYTGPSGVSGRTGSTTTVCSSQPP